MKFNNTIQLKVLIRNLAFVVLLSASFAAFATLGDGKKSAALKNPLRSLLSYKTVLSPGTFSLKSGYNFRGSQVFKIEKDEFIRLNTVATYQKGNTTYILPLKKKVLLEKVNFNPGNNTRK